MAAEIVEHQQRGGDYLVEQVVVADVRVGAEGGSQMVHEFWDDHEPGGMTLRNGEIGYRCCEMGLASARWSCEDEPSDGAFCKPYGRRLGPSERCRLNVIGPPRRVEGVESQALEGAEVAVMQEPVGWLDAPGQSLAMARYYPAEFR